MSKLGELFRSKQTTDIPEPDAPSRFQVEGGWGAAAEGSGVIDDDEGERSARREGVSVAAQLERQRLERLKAQREAEPLPSGHDYTKGLG